MGVGMEHRDLTEIIIGCGFRVHGTMGFGFLESVYENCMRVELSSLGLKVEAQKPITVYYEDQVVGDYVADLLVDDVLIIELKSVRNLVTAHEVQLANYLQATRVEVGLLINFGEQKVDVKRKLRVLPSGSN